VRPGSSPGMQKKTTRSSSRRRAPRGSEKGLLTSGSSSSRAFRAGFPARGVVRESSPVTVAGAVSASHGLPLLQTLERSVKERKTLLACVPHLIKHLDRICQTGEMPEPAGMSRAAPSVFGTGQPFEGKGSKRGKGGDDSHELLRWRDQRRCIGFRRIDGLLIGWRGNRRAEFSAFLMSITIISQIGENKQYFLADSRNIAFIGGQSRFYRVNTAAADAYRAGTAREAGVFCDFGRIIVY
jgi:hypothetical protein